MYYCDTIFRGIGAYIHSKHVVTSLLYYRYFEIVSHGTTSCRYIIEISKQKRSLIQAKSFQLSCRRRNKISTDLLWCGNDVS